MPLLQLMSGYKCLFFPYIRWLIITHRLCDKYERNPLLVNKITKYNHSDAILLTSEYRQAEFNGEFI
jgi:hypothetical protein